MEELPSCLHWVKNKNKEINGVQVDIYLSTKRHRKNFNFANYGGKEEALLQAIEYRDTFCSENDIELKPKKEPTSDIVGVSRTEYYDITDGKKVLKAKWQAVWQTEPGKQKTARFSVFKYGEEKAKALAIEAREHAISALKSGRDPIFKGPKYKSAKLWRYMDFTKFISMLENSGIYFAQADTLGDPFEGSYSRGNEKNRKFVHSRQKEPPKEIDTLVEEINKRRKGIMISCWHYSNHESAAIWKLYAKSNEAICIQTDYNKLSRSIDEEANIGMVRYIDYENNWIPEKSYYYPFMYKRKSFEHENELRAIIDIEDIKQKDLYGNHTNGYWKKVDMNYLIQKVYVSPDSPEWLLDLTKSICKKYGIKAKVVNSRLSGLPLY